MGGYNEERREIGGGRGGGRGRGQVEIVGEKRKGKRLT